MKLRQQVFTILAFVAVVAMLPASAMAEQPVTLHGSAPAWANSSNFAGSADPNENVGFRVYLGWSSADAAEALAHAVSDPKSSQYGQYLTPAQFRNQFAPSQAQVSAVQSWLKSQGFSVIYTPTNNHYVAAEGTVAQAQAAFLTQFGMYNVAGKSVRSPSHDVAIPSSWASMVNGIIGLDESAVFVQTNHIKDAPPSAGFRNAPPLSAFWAQFVSPYAYPAGFRNVANPRTAPWTVKGYTPA